MQISFMPIAETSRPSSSSKPPQGSQIMPRKIRESIEKAEEEIKEIEAQLTKTFRRSIDEKTMARSINKDIQKEEQKLNLIDAEFPVIDEELRDKYILVAHLKELYPEDP